MMKEKSPTRSAYEQSHCEILHSEDFGRRECNSCGKRLHCGCISLTLLLEFPDSGGVNCSSCAGISSLQHFDSSTTSSSQQVPPSQHLLPKSAKLVLASSFEGNAAFVSQIHVATPPAEGQGRNQLLARYWTRMTDQELQQISEDSNSIIVLLCEKVLRASDAGQIGRLVMPKACAEAYFHPISQPEGLPLRIQDVKGKEWVFQFRFWPNNTSRMYVLDGITPYIESIQLQVGDTVTFSCRDPKGKIVMGFRKASTSIAMQAAHPDLYPMVSHHHLPLSLPLRKKENIKHIQPEYWPPKLLLGFLLVVICLCTSFVEISCSIHEYNNENFVQKSNAFFFYGGSEGLYASKDHCDCRSFIRFEDVRFLRTKDSNSKANGTRNNTGLVETIIFDIKEREQIQGFFVKSKEICCSPDLAERGFCQLGQVIIKKKQDGAEWPKRFTTFFKWKNEEAKIDDITIDVERTGMYYLYFVICDPRLNNTLIRGRTVWRNQGGYLPGGMAPLVTFFGIMSLPYLLLGLFWLCRFVQHWKDIIPLHYCIAAVIALGLCEMALWFFVYANLNSRGRRPMGMTLLCAVSVTAVEKTLSRLLLLVVSSGSGVLRPTLSDITLRVLFLGCSYLFSSELYGLDMHWGIINDLPANSSLYLALPVTFVDVSFIMWIFISLAHTLDELQMRRNVIKLKLYTKFTIVFAVSTLLSIAWVAFQMAFELTDPPSEWWQIYWIIPAGWTILAYSLLVVVCMLWVPSHNPRRYAYLEETDDSTEEGIALTDMRR